MKTRNILLLLGTVLFASAASYAAVSAPKTLHYKVKLKSGGFGDMGTRDVWLKGGMMRCDIKTTRLPLTILKNRKGVFLVHAWNKVAGQYPDNSSRGNPRALLPGPTGSPKAFLVEMKAVRSGKEKIGTQNCDIYGYTEPVTKRYCKLWLDKKSGKPVKLWMKGKLHVMPDVTATYVAFVEGARVSDSFFDVPKDHVIRPMPKRELASKAPAKQPNSGRAGI